MERLPLNGSHRGREVRADAPPALADAPPVLAETGQIFMQDGPTTRARPVRTGPDFGEGARLHRHQAIFVLVYVIRHGQRFAHCNRVLNNQLKHSCNVVVVVSRFLVALVEKLSCVLFLIN